MDGDSDQRITDPRTADRVRYETFCGFFTVRRGGVTLAGRSSFADAAVAPAVAAGRTVVRLGVFSGLPDPEWVLEADEETLVLAKLVSAARRPRLTAREPVRPRTGYRGFLVDRPGVGPGTRERTIVCAGVLNDVRLTTQQADDGLEADLLDQARRRGFGGLL